MKRNLAVIIALALTISVLAGYLMSCSSGGGGSSSAPLSSAKEITAFAFTSPAATGAIGQSANTILVNVPSGSNVTALVATFSTTGSSVKVGSTVQVSGVTPNDFTSPVIYTVTAADGSIQNYLVTVRAGALTAQWARTVTAGSGNSRFSRVSVASDGSAYTAGYIDGTSTYDFGNSVTATGTYSGHNIVLVKYNSSGVAQWARTVTAGSDESWFSSIAVASDGSVYATGEIYGTGTYNFGNSVTTAGTSSSFNMVLVKYNSSGVTQWARTVIAGSGDSYFDDVSVASDNSVYASGEIQGTGTYDFGNSVTAAGTYSGYNIVLVKYDSSGAAMWARTLSAASDESWFSSVSVASDGSVYAAGGISGTGTYNFGNSVTTAGTYSSGSNIVLVKYNSSGVAQWAQTVTTGSDNSWFDDVSVASDGSVHASGAISGTGTYNFGNSVTAAGTYVGAGGNIVLVKYNRTGAAQWAQTVTAGSSYSRFNSVSVASDGSVCASGAISGTGAYTFGNNVTAVGTATGNNLVLVKYNGSGVAQWAQTVTTGSDDSWFFSTSVASDGSVYASGEIQTGTYSFGNNVSAAGPWSGENIVLVKYY